MKNATDTAQERLLDYLCATDSGQEGEGWALLTTVRYLGMRVGLMPAPQEGVLFVFPR